MPFGGVRVDSKAGSWSEQRQYIGKDYDSTSGYNYFDARYYDSGIKRFISQDPAVRDKPEDFLADPQQLNFYAYARNSPIVYKDPSGRCVDGISTAACVTAVVLLTGIVAGSVAELYGAITGDVKVIQAGQSARMIGESGGAALIQARGGMNPITGQKGMEFKEGEGVEKPLNERSYSGPRNNINFKPGGLDSHYIKHKGEWSGDLSRSQYLQKAQGLLSTVPAKGIETHIRKNGDVLRYNPQTNEFGVRSSEGVIRSFFRPTDGQKYWESQKKNN